MDEQRDEQREAEELETEAHMKRRGLDDDMPTEKPTGAESEDDEDDVEAHMKRRG